MISEHNDEKTKHYQLILRTTNLKTIKILGLTAKARHKNLKQIHLDEKEFNDKQELKN